MEENTKQENIQNINKLERPPVVAVMGHVDHGKSTLLDYIRHTNVAETEAGGITQTISAYEVIHKDESGKEKKITFLDTPGHEAFSKMRERGAKVADIAILVVSAEDGVKPQTLEAWKTITESNTPVIVAINKIDKPGANVEKTKMELAENEIYLENYGGKIPFTEISAKTGEGVDNLLTLINILAEMENFTGNPKETASGFVIEANLDSRRGIQATLVIKNGTLRGGMTVAVSDSICSSNIVENFMGKKIKEATFSSPIRLIGWNKMPEIGSEFITFEKKRQAEDYAIEHKKNFYKPIDECENDNDKKIIPIVLKADVWGSIEAIEKEIDKIKSDNTKFKIIQKGVGLISESDIKSIYSSPEAIVIGFNTKADKNAEELAQTKNITINYFNIIYKMTEWLAEEMEKKRLKVETVETKGRAKILKTFSRTKEKQIVGGKVLEGKINMNGTVKIMRRDFEIGKGKIVNLEKNKTKVGEVEEGAEFGCMIESKFEITSGDVIESFAIVNR